MAQKNDVRQTLQASILAALRGVTGEDQLTVLLLDDTMRRVVSRCCRLSEVMADANITLVEHILAPEAKRAPPAMAAHLSAVYLIAPTESSVFALEQELTTRRRLYGGKRHILVSSALPGPLRGTLRVLSAGGALASLREGVAVEALELHAGAFSLDRPSALRRLYGPPPPLNEDNIEARLLQGEDEAGGERAAAVSHAAEQLAKLCALLGDATPSVR